MPSPSVLILGAAIAAPATAITNVILSLEGWSLFRRLHRLPNERARLWSRFFLFLAVCTLAGAVKHGIPHYLSEYGLTLVLMALNVATGLATLCAQLGTLASVPWSQRSLRLLRVVAYTQFGVFAAWAVVSPTLALALSNTAVGLIPVTVVEGWRWLRRYSGAAGVVVGLAVAMLAAPIYLVPVSPAPWFNHVDLAHVVMMVSLLVIHEGVASGAHPRDREVGPGRDETPPARATWDGERGMREVGS